MRLFKLLKYDIKQGFFYVKWCLLMVAVFTFVSCIDFYSGKNRYYTGNGITPIEATFFDYLFYLFKGMKEYLPHGYMIFKLPIKWFLFQVCYLLGVLYYPYRDLQNSVGSIVIVKGSSRRTWWVSKCVWCILYILAVYSIIYIVIAVFCLMASELLSWSFTSQLMKDYMDINVLPYASEKDVLLFVLVVPVLVSIVMSTFELFTGALTKPIVGFFLTTLYFLTSAYKLSPYLLGNYLMGVRSCFFIENGVHAEIGIYLCLVNFSFLLVMGKLLIGRKDILNMSEI